MLMFAQSSLESESSLIVPYFDLGVVRTGDDEGLRGMDNDASDEVVVSFKGLYFLHGVVVEDSDLEVVAPGNNPVLTANELDGSDREGRGLKGSDACLCC